jgi:hypothetical protein
LSRSKIGALATAPASSFAKPNKPVNIDKVISIHRRDLTTRLLVQLNVVRDLECALEIDNRWLPGGASWQEAVRLREEHELRSCVTMLEQLCVERLFEMEKSLNGNTGKYYWVFEASFINQINRIQAAGDDFKKPCNTLTDDQKCDQKVQHTSGKG